MVKVSDGDTITVLDANKVQHKVRLYGIDAPEKKQAFGKVSKDGLWNRISMYSTTVRVHVVNRDRYGRIVGIVWACACCPSGDLTWDCGVNGRSVNEDMIDYGYAWAYTSYLKKADKPLYSQLEAGARWRKSGLWADAHPLAPWKFRKSKKK